MFALVQISLVVKQFNFNESKKIRENKNIFTLIIILKNRSSTLRPRTILHIKNNCGDKPSGKAISFGEIKKISVN